MPDDFRTMDPGAEPGDREGQILNVMIRALQKALEEPMSLYQGGRIISEIRDALRKRGMLDLTPGPQSLNEGQPAPMGEPPAADIISRPSRSTSSIPTGSFEVTPKRG